MAARSWRLLDLRKLTANLEQPRDQYVDAGAFVHLEVDVRVPAAGAAGTLKVQHAAVMEPDAFRDLPGMTFTLSGGSPGGFASTDHFLRYLRWITDSAVAGNPQAIVDIVGKE